MKLWSVIELLALTVALVPNAHANKPADEKAPGDVISISNLTTSSGFWGIRFQWEVTNTTEQPLGPLSFYDVLHRKRKKCELKIKEYDEFISEKLSVLKGMLREEVREQYLARSESMFIAVLDKYGLEDVAEKLLRFGAHRNARTTRTLDTVQSMLTALVAQASAMGRFPQSFVRTARAPRTSFAFFKTREHDATLGKVTCHVTFELVIESLVDFRKFKKRLARIRDMLKRFYRAKERDTEAAETYFYSVLDKEKKRRRANFVYTTKEHNLELAEISLIQEVLEVYHKQQTYFVLDFMFSFFDKLYFEPTEQ